MALFSEYIGYYDTLIHHNVEGVSYWRCMRTNCTFKPLSKFLILKHFLLLIRQLIIHNTNEIPARYALVLTIRRIRLHMCPYLPCIAVYESSPSYRPLPKRSCYRIAIEMQPTTISHRFKAVRSLI